MRGWREEVKQDKIEGNQSRNQMKAVQLSPNVRFLSLEDKEGVLGLFLVHSRDTVYETREVHSREEFTEVYQDIMMKLEQI